MNQVRIGLIGCGNFGESHLQAFRAVPGAEIAGVFDTDRNRALRIAHQFGISRVCDSIEEICRMPDLSAIGTGSVYDGGHYGSAVSTGSATVKRLDFGTNSVYNGGN